MAKIVLINGSYRTDGISDKIVRVITDTLSQYNHKIEYIDLKEKNILHCHNCRTCTQKEGEEPGECVIEDDMQGIIDKIESSDGLVLISPTNFSTVTALFKTFMERLIVYGFWPWENPFPKNRKEKAIKKKAIVISSCAAPSFMGRWMFDTIKLLKMTAKVLGADVVDSLMIGLISQNTDIPMQDSHRDKVIKIAKKLNRSFS